MPNKQLMDKYPVPAQSQILSIKN